ncbi:TPA: hypothetical protein HLT81_24770 [Escherichia coli]|uniref:helix-turn-helix transcriptional regulator n=1 Tax=Brevibacillus agri TaxID=51101 RepID=UPI00176088F2|nr:hypothetical protein [Brevibacillus agri]MDR9504120.1 hypothetical protein [Brevibacillus agri]MED3501751.1 hypothetical protein [Brevibacillus agri]HAJ4019690.1 hypothetical protein [Escherichia coli]
MYYKGYDYDGQDGQIKVVSDVEWSARIATEQFALELIGFLQNFFDLQGKIRKENTGKTLPPLVGVAEAAEILGWDKRQVSTYVKRYVEEGKFPKPIQTLASGSIWTLKQIEDYRDQRESKKRK